MEQEESGASGGEGEMGKTQQLLLLKRYNGKAIKETHQWLHL